MLDRIIKNRYVAGVSGLVALSFTVSAIMRSLHESPLYLDVIFLTTSVLYGIYYLCEDRISIKKHKEIVGDLHKTIDDLSEVVHDKNKKD